MIYVFQFEAENFKFKCILFFVHAVFGINAEIATISGFNYGEPEQSLSNM